VKCRERSYSGGCDEHCLRGIAGPPVSSAVFSLTPPPGNAGGRPYFRFLATWSQRVGNFTKGGVTFLAAQRVPETPQEINQWLKGTISVPELLLMSFQESSEENLIVEYSPEMSESESGGDFANLRPVAIEGSHQLLLGHSDTTMEVDVEGLLLCETPHKPPLQDMAIPEIAIVFPHEERAFEMPPSITADFCFEHINRVNRELRTLRSDYTTVRKVLCFWQPQLDKMATWF